MSQRITPLPSRNDSRSSQVQRVTPLPSRNDSSSSQVLSILPRDSFKPLFGYCVKSLEVFEAYLERTRLEVRFKKLLKLLLSRVELPYNPYPGFVMRLRRFAEQFHLNSDDDYTIKECIDQQVREFSVSNLYTQKEYHTVFGLKGIVKSVNQVKLRKFQWLVDDLTPLQEDLFYGDGYGTQVMVSLVGPTAFLGSFYESDHTVNIRVEYLVAGPEVSRAIAIFVDSVMYDIDHMASSMTHILLGVSLPIQDEENPNTWNFSFWHASLIEEEKGNFLQALSDAVITNRYIIVECIFRLDPHEPDFIYGRKQFGLNYIQVIKRTREEGLQSFCEFPMSSLHEGIFLNKEDAENYMIIFSPQMDKLEKEYVQADVPGTSHSQRSALDDLDTDGLQQHVHKRLEHIHPKKVKIDGFRVEGDTGYGPYAWQITSPIKSHLQKRIASNHLYEDFFDSVHSILILALMERELYGWELLIEIYRILHSTAGKMYLILEQNKSVRAIISGLTDTGDPTCIRKHMNLYKSAIEDLFMNNFQERSSDLKSVGEYLIGKVNDLLNVEDEEFIAHSHCMKMKIAMRKLNQFSKTILLQLTEDTVANCPQIMELIEQLKESFPNEARRLDVMIRERTHRFEVGSRRNTQSASIYKHGLEDGHIMKHETNVVDVSASMKEETAYEPIAMETVLMRYLIDTHLDDVWHEFQMDLLIGSHLPPNPFYRLVSKFRQCVQRMDLCYEESNVLLDRMKTPESQLIDKGNYVYTVPGLEAFGVKSITSFLDSRGFSHVIEIINNYVQRKYIQRMGPFKVALCLAVSGWTPFYGIMQPYLNNVELHEHYYIQGPTKKEKGARELFAKMVFNHLNDLMSKRDTPIVGVFLGSGETKWTWRKIFSKKHAFLSEVEKTVQKKQPVFMKAYTGIDGWRYLQIKKHFLLHFMSGEDHKIELFYTHNPEALYQNVFLEKARAGFHYQNCAPAHKGDPMSVPNINSTFHGIDREIVYASGISDWLTVYRYLLLKDIMQQTLDMRVDCWRMFHSITTLIEYLCQLTEDLQDLVTFCIDWEKDEPDIPVEKQNDEESSNKDKKEDPDKVSRTSEKEKEKKLETHMKMKSKKQKTKTKKSLLSRIFKKKRSVNIGCSSAMKSIPLDYSMLSRMIKGFIQKLDSIRATRGSRKAQCASSLRNVINMKLSSVMEKDSTTGELFFISSSETLSKLEEVKNLLTGLQIPLSGDVHSICPTAMYAVGKICEETDRRSSSVLSQHLDEPGVFLNKSTTKMTIGRG